MLNQARLKVLKVREDHVRNVLDAARVRLAEVPKDEGLYGDLMVVLIVQALFQVTIHFWGIQNFFLYKKECQTNKWSA